MQAFRDEIAALVSARVDAPLERVESLLAKPRKPEWGDLALPCHPFGKKEAGRLARRLAEEIQPQGLVGAVEATGPFLNFRLDPAALVAHVLGEIHARGGRYGASEEGAGKTIVVDYSSPNIAKPFHVGHLRTTIIGASLCRIFEMLGYDVVRVNHLGDWGTQFGLTQVAFEEWGDETRLESEGVDYLVELYVEASEKAGRDASFREKARAAFKALEESDDDARAFWRRIREISLRDFQRVYDQMGVTFDAFEGESFYNDKIEDAIRQAAESGVTEESEGALAVFVDGRQKAGDREMPPLLLRKSDGASTYHARDLAAALYRKATYGFHRNVYVVGSEQTLHFQQLFKLLKMMKLPWADDCIHVPFGRVHGMSTRSGGAIRLDELFDKGIEMAASIIREQNDDLDEEQVQRLARPVGMGAAFFFDLSRRRMRDAEFRWVDVLQPIGDTGPYVQYTHARFCSILRKWGGSVSGNENVSLLSDPHEINLTKALAEYPAAIAEAEMDLEPSLIASYLLDLAAAANRFHHNCRVIDREASLAAARALLVDCTRRVLCSGLNLLGIEAPERM